MHKCHKCGEEPCKCKPKEPIRYTEVALLIGMIIGIIIMAYMYN